MVGDSPSVSKRIKRLIKEGKEEFVITDVTIAEIVWVLASYYEQKKEDIATNILSLLEVPLFKTNKSLITQAINYYREYNIDYIDAYLIAYAQDNRHEGILSLDKSIDKVKDIKRFEP